MLKQREEGHNSSPNNRLKVTASRDILTNKDSSENRISDKSHGSGESFDLKDDKLHLFAHTVLPRT